MTTLGGSTTVDVGPAPTVLLPLGSVEQHGPHLPLDTDARVASWAVEAAVTARPTWLAAPPLPYGASGEHEGAPGTVSIGTEALVAVLVEWGRSACRWAGRVLIVNGHGGNVEALTRAVPQLRAESRDVAWWAPRVAGGDTHAGHVETSLLLHLAPELVRCERMVVGDTRPLSTLLPELRRRGVPGVSPTGVLGDPTTATAGRGSWLAAALLEQLVAAADGWQVTEWGGLQVGAVELSEAPGGAGAVFPHRTGSS